MSAKNVLSGWLPALIGVASSLAGGCTDQIAADNGLVSKVRVANAQFEDKPFPVDTDSDAQVPEILGADGGIVGAPAVVSITTSTFQVVRGTAGKSLVVDVEPSATTVEIGLHGERGYWVAPVTGISIESPPDLELTVAVDFDRSIPVGPARLDFVAVDASGRRGQPQSLNLTITDDTPKAPLVVQLEWTQNMDLDLVIVQPDGTTLTNKATRSPNLPATAPVIDIDSNANCVIDGHRVENAIYQAVPPGVYSVYVRQAAPCSVTETGWTVRLIRDGQTIQSASGVAYAFENDQPNGGPSGTGRLALQFSIGG